MNEFKMATTQVCRTANNKNIKYDYMVEYTTEEQGVVTLIRPVESFVTRSRILIDKNLP